MDNIPAEIVINILSYVDSVSTIYNLLQVCRRWNQIIADTPNDEFLQTAVTSLCSCLYPVPLDNGKNSKGGRWWNAARRYISIDDNIKKGFTVVDQPFHKNVVPPNCSQLRLVTESAREIVVPRSILQLRQNIVVFSWHAVSSESLGPVPMQATIDFSSRTFSLAKMPESPDSSVGLWSWGARWSSIVEGEGENRRSWVFPSSEHVHLVGAFRYLDVETDDRILVKVCKTRTGNYRFIAMSPDHNGMMFDFDVGVPSGITSADRTRFEPAVLFTAKVLIVVTDTINIYSLPYGDLLATCPAPLSGSQRGHARIRNPCRYATTQTHLWALDGPCMYAISIEDILKHHQFFSRDFGHWTRICDLGVLFGYKERDDAFLDGAYDAERDCVFSELRFYDQFVTVCWDDALYWIDLIKGTSQLVRINDAFLDSPPSDAFWIIDSEGTIIYLSRDHLTGLANDYIKKGLTGKVSLDILACSAGHWDNWDGY